MLKRGIALGFWLGMSSFLASAQAFAKPADLPSHTQIECVDGDEPMPRRFSIELDINARGITLKVGAGTEQPEPAPAIDALMPAFVEQWLQHMADALSRPDRSGNLDYLLSRMPFVTGTPASPAKLGVTGQTTEVDKEQQVRRLYHVAELYRRTGRYESARHYYQRVHLVSPTSRLGQSAIERIQEIEERLRDAAEEQGRDDPEASNRDIRNGSMLLGLVEITH